MKTDINKLSFIVLIKFGFGIGTQKGVASEAIKALKKNKCFIDKCSARETVTMAEGDCGCAEYKYVARINTQGLKTLLWDYIYPEEIVHTMGSLSLEYGACDAIAFNSCFRQSYPNERTVDLTVAKICKQLTGESFVYPLPYKAAIAEGMAGFCDFSVYVTPVEQHGDDFRICEEVWSFFESLMKIPCCDRKDEFDDFFDINSCHMSLDEIEKALDELKNE